MEFTQDQKWGHAKRLAAKMNKLIKDFIKVDVEVAYIGLCVGKQRLLVGGTTKGVNLITLNLKESFPHLLMAVKQKIRLIFSTSASRYKNSSDRSI